jgi:hypothetical protein
VRPWRAEAEYDPDGTLRVALIEHSYMLAKWEGMHVANARIVPHACRCGHLHNFQPGAAASGSYAASATNASTAAIQTTDFR